MKETIAYKIVSSEMESYMLSWFKEKGIHDYNLLYALNKTTVKKKRSLGIMCFDTFNNALGWVSKYSDGYKILKIKGIKSKKQNKEIAGHLEFGLLTEWYKNKIKDRLFFTPPIGTVFFDEVTPIEIMREG